MNFDQVLATAVMKAPLPALANDLRAVAHKLRYPMALILAKVPGDTLAERARNIGVSRQTMYVWAQERFRPSGGQAAIIAKLTGVPVEQIGDYQEGKHDGAGKTPRKKITRMAKASRSLSARDVRKRTKPSRLGVKSKLGRSPRTLRKRTQRRPVSSKSD